MVQGLSQRSGPLRQAAAEALRAFVADADGVGRVVRSWVQLRGQGAWTFYLADAVATLVRDVADSELLAASAVQQLCREGGLELVAQVLLQLQRQLLQPALRAASTGDGQAWVPGELYPASSQLTCTAMPCLTVVPHATSSHQTQKLLQLLLCKRQLVVNPGTLLLVTINDGLIVSGTRLK
jgi:hypothetical protein